MAAKTAEKPRGFSLFDLTSDTVQHDLLERALQRAEESGLDQEEAMQKALASVDKLTSNKVIAYALRILQWESEAEQIKKEVARQQKRQAVREAWAEGLRSRLVELLPHDGIYEDQRAKVSFRNYPKIETNLDELDAQYVEEVPASKKLADHAALKKAALQAVKEYEEQVQAHLAAGMTAAEAAKEAAPRLLKGVTVKENWKVAIK